MYLAYYGLQKEPFHTTPDPNFVYMSPSHKEALGAIIYGIEKRKGFIAIIGEVGVGKTTILRTYLERHAQPKQKIVYIFNPVVSYHGLLTSIFKELDLIPVHKDETEMVNQLHEALVEEYKSGGTVVLVIDEAQNMPIATLENLRMLSNLETSTDKLIQIILVGQPELETLLQQPALRQFRQRIALRAMISPLTQKESQAFIEHRIAVASSEANSVFTNGALKMIAREAQGIPRRLNILSDNALITGYGRQCRPVPASVVKEILADIDVTHSSVLWKWAVGACLVLLLAIGTMFFWKSFFFRSSSEAVQTIDLKEHRQAPKNRVLVDTRPKKVAINSPSALRQPEPSDSVLKPMMPLKAEPKSLSVNKSTVGVPINSENPNGDVSNNFVETSLSNQEKAVQGLPGSQEEVSTQQGTSDQVDHGTIVTRAVKEGENLSQIANETYGSKDLEYVEWVKRHNPHIVNPDVILPGQQVVLPEYHKDTKDTVSQ